MMFALKVGYTKIVTKNMRERVIKLYDTTKTLQLYLRILLRGNTSIHYFGSHSSYFIILLEHCMCPRALHEKKKKMFLSLE